MAILALEDNALHAYDMTIIFMVDYTTLKHHVYHLYGRHHTNEEVLEWMNKFDEYKNCEILRIIK